MFLIKSNICENFMIEFLLIFYQKAVNMEIETTIESLSNSMIVKEVKFSHIFQNMV